MATEVILPRQGQSVESCIIAAWHVAEGDAVSEGDVLCEVETDKATFEVEAPASGTVLKRYYGEDDDVAVLSTLAMIGESGERVPDEPPTVAGKDTSAGGGGTEPSQAVGEKAETTTTSGAGAGRGGVTSAAATASDGSPKDKLRISPRARRVAERLGVDYSALDGSGPGGRILVRDIEAVGDRAGGQASGVDMPAGDRRKVAEYPGPFQEQPLKGVRKVIAERMRASLADTAQLTMHRHADARAILALRRRMKEAAGATEAGATEPAGTTPKGEMAQAVPSINHLVLFAVSRALARHPDINAHLENGVLRRYKNVHLGFAVDTERGLYVPTIKNAGTLSLAAMADEARRLSHLCIAGKAGKEELARATFTVTNVGALGVESFTPILNPPQVAILGVSAIVPVPGFVSGEGQTVEWIPSIGLSLTIDHQAVDGVPGARFLATVAEALASFELTLTE